LRFNEVFLNWTSKDAVSVLISLTALCISLGSFYRTNLYVNDSVVVRSVPTSITHTVQGSREEELAATITMQVIFVNTGNRDAMVISVGVWALDINDLNGGGGGLTGEKFAPVLLKPGEIKLLDVPMEVPLILGHGVGKHAVLALSSLNSAGESFVLRIPFAKLEAIKDPQAHDVAVVTVEQINEPLFQRR
jgi:hypothetical protein